MDSSLQLSGLGFPEGPVVMGDGRLVFCDGNVGELLEKSCDGLVGEFSLLGQKTDELSLG